MIKLKKYGALYRAVALLLLISLCLPALVACSPDESGNYAVIDVEELGEIVIQLDRANAPITVSNFILLAKSGFYKNSPIHRAIPGALFQGGMNIDGKKAEAIKGEFSSNGWENKLSHERGVISMARTSDPNSASSQFFICVTDCEEYDGEYASFGWVVEGMDIVERIALYGYYFADGNGFITNSDYWLTINNITIYNELPE